MAELLFIATTIFVAYVVFTVVGKKDSAEPAKPAEKAVTPPESLAKVETKPAPELVTTKPATSRASTKAAAPAKAAQTAADSLKNPKTGEVVKLPGNYAFAKRWIKDALVEEGLLEKVYKNNELDSATTAKIQAALQQLKALPKYQ